MATVIRTTFKLRRGLAAEWREVNPILAAGEPGWAIDAEVLKIGDGVSHWNELNAVNSSTVSISPDQKSLAHDADGKLTVYGFEDAEINQIPCKSETGELIWLTLAKSAFTGMIDDLQQRDTIILCGGGAPRVEDL